MKTSQKGIDLITRFEGVILHSYLCPKGVLTIGVGHTGSDVTKDMVITEKEAENLLKKDLKNFESKLNYSLEHDNLTLNQNQFDACISFIFNLGYSAFIFSTLYKKLKAGDYEGASDEFLKWVYITKTVNGERVKLRLKGLETRRNAERDLFLS
ncbi:MAG: lysozyme [Bacteroidales bacterium]|nr:lysozyme [Bacteroidales bacterium]